MSDDPLHLEGITLLDLRHAEGLQALDRYFLDYLDQHEPGLRQELTEYRHKHPTPTTYRSIFLLRVAPHLDRFVTQTFGIENEAMALRQANQNNDVVQTFKKQFVLRRARRYRRDFHANFDELDAWLDEELRRNNLAGEDREWAISVYGDGLLRQEHINADAIEKLTQWCVLGLKPDSSVAHWIAFKLPQRIDHGHLVPLRRVNADPLQRLQGSPGTFRRRDGFNLTDPRMPARAVHDQIHYCIYCHEHDGDFCSKGFPEKKGEPELGWKVDPLGVVLTGCPLDEKISEMHSLKRDGFGIAALAMVMVDNPMVPATGHRICNDCMKGCIYQKQDPVDIPQIETRVLTDVLELPWGVEIYDLLTRWNPLRQQQYIAKPYNGRKVLIAGMGPAGFTMAHHLTMEGCAVVGIDGLKIEPLPQSLLDQPIRDWSTLQESLDERILLGFGGVAEYGITVRWDKNFLKLILVTLLRRPTFQVFGGVRLGGTMTVEDAWELGFDHACLALGAGLPRVVPMGHSLARGMRQANDFLMGLQLTGAAKESSLANLQVRLPAVVIGGGLTAIDTATEVQAYYIKQVEKLSKRYEILVHTYGENKVVAGLNDEDRSILMEFLEHGRAIRAERERAATAAESPNFISLLQSWGGVTVAYRRGVNQSPAYIRNHEEITKAIEEGIYYAEGVEPMRAELDRYGHIKTMVFRRMEYIDGNWLATDEERVFPARGVYVAAGASPNIIYEKEYPNTFILEDNHFLAHVEHAKGLQHGLQPIQIAEHCKAAEFGPFTSYQSHDRTVSFLGDTHPMFAGSVVKAIASAKRSYPALMKALALRPSTNTDWGDYQRFRERMSDLLTPRIAEVRMDNPAVAEIWVRAPMAARNFRPGQFFRLQTYESLSPVAQGTRLQIPLLTVSGTGVKDDQIRLMILQWGAGPRLAAKLKPGDPLVLMGPNGTPTEIGSGETVIIVAGRWGAAVMLDIGPALRAAGNRVIYMAAFGSADELDRQDELEAAADQIIWCTAAEPTIDARRPQDASVVATDMVDLLRRYCANEIPNQGNVAAVPLHEVNRLMVMGSTSLLRGFQTALNTTLKNAVHPELQAIGTVGSPMQCMLKGICAQCLQWQIDPATGVRTRAVFSCAGQDQPLTWIDLDNLTARQTQNRLPDRLTALWLDYVLTTTI